MTDISLIDRLLDVIEHDIVPKTEDGIRDTDRSVGSEMCIRDSTRG